MMYDSSVFSSPHNIANTCDLCLYHIYRLIMLQQSGIVTRVDSCDKTRCSQIVSGNFTAMTIEGCQKQLTNSFHYLGEFDLQRAKDIRLSRVISESSKKCSVECHPQVYQNTAIGSVVVCHLWHPHDEKWVNSHCTTAPMCSSISATTMSRCQSNCATSFHYLGGLDVCRLRELQVRSQVHRSKAIVL